MPQIRVEIPQAFVDEITTQLRDINSDPSRKISANDIAREALSVFKWVVNSKHAGKSVIATKDIPENFRSFVSPNLPD